MWWGMGHATLAMPFTFPGMPVYCSSPCLIFYYLPPVACGQTTTLKQVTLIFMASGGNRSHLVMYISCINCGTINSNERTRTSISWTRELRSIYRFISFLKNMTILEDLQSSRIVQLTWRGKTRKWRPFENFIQSQNHIHILEKILEKRGNQEN